MTYTKTSDEQLTTTNQSQGKELIVTEYGIRSLTKQGFSKVIVLPKGALLNIGKMTQFNIQMIQGNGVKYLKLSPINPKTKAT